MDNKERLNRIQSKNPSLLCKLLYKFVNLAYQVYLYNFIYQMIDKKNKLIKIILMLLKDSVRL